MRYSNTSLFKTALIYSFIVLLALTLPFYFYVKESMSKLKSQEMDRATQDTLSITLMICSSQKLPDIIKNNPDKHLAFIGLDNKVIHSNIEHLEEVNWDKSPNIVNDTIYIIRDIENGKDGLSKFVLAHNIDYFPLMEKFAMFLAYILTFLLLSSFAMIYFSIRPILEANRYLDQFFQDAMHEFRTPVGVMQLNFDLIKVEPSSLNAYKRASASLKNLISVYEDIEYFIKYKSVKFQKEQIDLSTFLEDRVTFFALLAELKNITIKTNIETDIKVSMNRIEIQRIIDNTISNAIKYSTNGKTISISLRSNETEICLEVIDEGEGIADIQRIFKRYYRGDEIRGGFGIGLSIVKKICDKYDIKIIVDSELKKGSTFKYILKKYLS